MGWISALTLRQTTAGESDDSELPLLFLVQSSTQSSSAGVGMLYVWAARIGQNRELVQMTAY